MKTLADVPDVILFLIKDYLHYECPLQYAGYIRRTKQGDWLRLMRTTQLFSLIRRQTLYVHLNEQLSERFLNDFVFRSHVTNQLVEIPSQQIELSLHQYWKYPKLISKVHSATLSDLFLNNTDLECLQNLKILNFHTVKFGEEPEVLLLPVTGFFSSLELLSFTNCIHINVEFFQSLIHLKELSLVNISFPVDLTLFEEYWNLKKIQLENCTVANRNFSLLASMEEVILADILPMEYSVLQDCKRITVSHVDFYGEFIKWFTRVEELTIETSEDILFHISQFQQLQFLRDLTIRIFATDSDQITAQFNNLPALKSFWFEVDPFTVEIDFQLINCKNIRTVNLQAAGKVSFHNSIVRHLSIDRLNAPFQFKTDGPSPTISIR
jgi:hypothetical protein